MQGSLLLLHLRDGLLDIFRRQLIKVLSQELAIAVDLLLKFVALFAHGLTAGIRRERVGLSVTDDCRGRVDDDYNSNQYVGFPTLIILVCVPVARRGGNRSTILCRDRRA